RTGGGWVVRGDQEHNAGPVRGDGGLCGVHGDTEVVTTRYRHPFRVGAPGDDRVHRVGRCETHRDPAGAAEGLQDLLQGLVGSVGGPHVVGGQAVAEVVRELLP